MQCITHALVALFFFYLAHCSPATPRPLGSLSNTRSPDQEAAWNGWDDIHNIFSFGDSYSSTGFKSNGTQPSEANPIGNPAFPGETYIGSPDWTTYLIADYNASFVRLFNFAFPDATIDNNIDPSPPGAPSFQQQLQIPFNKLYRSGNGRWTPADTLFTVMFGVNDVLLVHQKPHADQYIAKLMISYIRFAQDLYTAGGRNFLFFNVPAIDRIPYGNSSTTTIVYTETVQITITPHGRIQLEQFITKFNIAMQLMTQIFRALHPEATVWLFDTNTLFNRVLNNPTIFNATAGIKNTKGYCVPYANSEDTELFSPQCGVPRSAYFWTDNLHPTSTVQKLIAQQVAIELEKLPQQHPN